MDRALSDVEHRPFNGLHTNERHRAQKLIAIPVDSSHGEVRFDQVEDFEDVDDDGRLSITGAFCMYLVGVASGVFWTLLLFWLF